MVRIGLAAGENMDSKNGTMDSRHLLEDKYNVKEKTDFLWISKVKLLIVNMLN